MAKNASKNIGISFKKTEFVCDLKPKAKDRQQSISLPYRLFARLSSHSNSGSNSRKHTHNCFLGKASHCLQRPLKEIPKSKSEGQDVCINFKVKEKVKNNKMIDRLEINNDKYSMAEKDIGVTQADRDDLYCLSSSNKLPENDGKTQKVVSFKNLSIREYELIIGDNPSCSVGLPITLGWNHTDDKIIDIDHYETNRKPRRKPSEFRLASDIRFELLCGKGIDRRREIHHIERKLYKERKPCKLDKFFAPAMETEKKIPSRAEVKNLSFKRVC